MNKLKVFEAFAGYGTQSIALRNLGINYEVVAISETDSSALKAYEALHGEVNNLGDITKIKLEDIPTHDLFTYSFPCQDISVAGRQQGIEKGKTRSGLLYECERIIEAKRPKYLLLENVKNLVGKKFKPQFDEWLEYLETLGYTNYWKVLNAKDYGVPQNRERVFVVSVLGEHNQYEFPLSVSLMDKAKCLLEDSVDSQYYISQDRLDFFLSKLDDDKKRYIAHNVVCEQRFDEGLRFFKNDLCGTLRTIDSCGDKRVLEVTDNLRARKLTPKECFRFMGMNDYDIDKILNAGLSNPQMYKLAGNAIVVNVLEAIFKELFVKEGF